MSTFLRVFVYGLLALSLGLSAATVAVGQSENQHQGAFGQLLEPYEAIRQALMQDSVTGVGEQGKLLAEVLKPLVDEWSHTAAGVAADHSDALRPLVPDMLSAAQALAKVESLEQARDAFYALSKPMVRFHKAAVGAKPMVVYCAMAKRSWLQPEGEVGNPYHGSQMLTCGQEVAEARN